MCNMYIYIYVLLYYKYDIYIHIIIYTCIIYIKTGRRGSQTQTPSGIPMPSRSGAFFLRGKRVPAGMECLDGTCKSSRGSAQINIYI
jgi:hypothetical protein